jgi:hypothetical protein
MRLQDRAGQNLTAITALSELLLNMMKHIWIENIVEH